MNDRIIGIQKLGNKEQITGIIKTKKEKKEK